MTPTADTPTNLSRSDLQPGVVLIDPLDRDRHFRIDRIDGDTVHCVAVDDSTLKRTLSMDTIIKKHWRLGKKAA